ncbi:hypothetical protein ACLOJK_019147 [Asimina triloba]
MRSGIRKSMQECVLWIDLNRLPKDAVGEQHFLSGEPSVEEIEFEMRLASAGSYPKPPPLECMRAVLENMIHLDDGSRFYLIGENARATARSLPTQPRLPKKTRRSTDQKADHKRAGSVESLEEDEEEIFESPKVEPTASIDEEADPHANVKMSPQVDMEAGPHNATGPRMGVVAGVEGDPEVPTRLTLHLARVRSMASTAEVGSGGDDGDRGAELVANGTRVVRQQVSLRAAVVGSIGGQESQGSVSFSSLPFVTDSVLRGMVNFIEDLCVNNVDRPSDDLSRFSAIVFSDAFVDVEVVNVTVIDVAPMGEAGNGVDANASAAVADVSKRVGMDDEVDEAAKIGAARLHTDSSVGEPSVEQSIPAGEMSKATPDYTWSDLAESSVLAFVGSSHDAAIGMGTGETVADSFTVTNVRAKFPETFRYLASSFFLAQGPLKQVRHFIAVGTPLARQRSRVLQRHNFMTRASRYSRCIGESSRLMAKQDANRAVIQAVVARMAERVARLADLVRDWQRYDCSGVQRQYDFVGESSSVGRGGLQTHGGGCNTGINYKICIATAPSSIDCLSAKSEIPAAMKSGHKIRNSGNNGWAN